MDAVALILRPTQPERDRIATPSKRASHARAALFRISGELQRRNPGPDVSPLGR
jgi:hypothetical protein